MAHRVVPAGAAPRRQPVDGAAAGVAGHRLVELLRGKPGVYSVPLCIPASVHYNEETNTLDDSRDDGDGRMVVVESTLRMVEARHEAFGVQSLVGPFRTGKSLIQSRLLGFRAFQVGHLQQACTKGIWLSTWALRRESDGLLILLLDAEGMGATTASDQRDFAVTSMSLLLSSLFVFNSKTVPNADDLEKLNVVLRVSQALRVRSDNVKLSEQRQVFPVFLWLLRDVALTSTDKAGRPCSFDAYLRDVVLAIDQDSPMPNDQLKHVILQGFPRFFGLTLPIPTADTATLQQMDAVDDSALVPEFVQQAARVAAEMLESVKAKRAPDGRTEMDGTSWAAMVRIYAEAVSTPNAIPSTANMWERAVGQVWQTVGEEIKALYQRNMDAVVGAFPMETGDLLQQHDAVFEQCQQEIVARAGHLRDDDTAKYQGRMETIRQSLAQFVEVPPAAAAAGGRPAAAAAAATVPRVARPMQCSGGLLLTYLERNMAASTTLCRGILKGPYDAMMDDARNMRKSFKELMRCFEELHATYEREARGPAKAAEYAALLVRWKDDSAIVEQLDGFQRKVADEQRRAAEAEAARQQRDQQRTEEMQMMRQMLEDSQREMVALGEIQRQALEQQQRQNREDREADREFLASIQRSTTEDTRRFSEQMIAMQEQNRVTHEQMMRQMQAESQRNAQLIVEAIRAMPPPQVIVQKDEGICNLS